MTDKPRITRDFTINPRGPLPTAVGVYYERYRKEKGSVPAPQAEAMLFAEYLLEHLEEFQAELKDVLHGHAVARSAQIVGASPSSPSATLPSVLSGLHEYEQVQPLTACASWACCYEL
jgi:hypothetical protein